tara:strand:+ start:173 stop:703 length:531 start_codon:yes stop_codon:yes gene_type:complete
LIRSLFILAITFIITKNVFGINIVVIDVEKIINSNQEYLDILNKIEENQLKESALLKENELEIENLLKEINDSKIILNEEELNNLIYNYNFELSKFNNKVEKFNINYQDQIIGIRKVILMEIVELSEKYAKENKIDLILDSTNYLIASNNINITDVIEEMLKGINLKLEIKNIEKN